MRLLMLGGTGLISVGILKSLGIRRQQEEIDVVAFNRGSTPAKDNDPLPDFVREVHGDRNDVAAMLGAFEGETFDVVVDMIAFTPEHAQATADLARQVKAKQLLFCSTVCTYGIDIPPGVVVDETFEQNPISKYGKDKVACERLLEEAAAKGDFALTIVRPSCTYGEGGPLIDQLEFNPPTWARVREGKPVVLAGDGLNLWNATHRDDVGKLFAHAAGREVTFGKAYNATTERVFTWRDFYREAAAHFDKPALVVFLPRDAIVAVDEKRFGLLKEITGYHGAYTSALAKRDVPEFTCDVDFASGASRAIAHLEKADKLKAAHDATYDKLVDMAKSIGVEPIEA